MRGTLYGLAFALLVIAALFAASEHPWSPRISRAAALLGAAFALLAYALPDLGLHA